MSNIISLKKGGVTIEKRADDVSEIQRLKKHSYKVVDPKKIAAVAKRAAAEAKKNAE